MSHDVAEWLAEIQTLQQQLAQTQQEREQAYASAETWRKLYETEAQQRRAEANLARQAIAQYQELAAADAMADSTLAAEQAVSQLEPTALRETLIAALTERDRLLQALETEQAAHAQTRKSLTLALGDAIDLLSKQSNAASTAIE